MSDSQEYNNFNQEDEEREPSLIENEIASSKVFRTLSNSLSIKEKVEWTVKLHDANYFLDKSIQELKKVDEYIRPLGKVTKKHIDKIRSTKALNNKLSWVMKNQDQEFAKQFINKLEKNEFGSVVKVQDEARKLFIEHNGSEYNSKQATHSTMDRDGKKERIVARRETRDTSTEQNQLQVFLERAKHKLKDQSIISLIDAHSSMNATQRKNDIDSNTPSIVFAKEAAGPEAGTKNKILTLTTIALVHEILESIGLEP